MTPDPRDITERLTEDERELLDALNRAKNRELLKDGGTTYYSGKFVRLIETIAHLRRERDALEDACRAYDQQVASEREDADRAEAEARALREALNRVVVEWDTRNHTAFAVAMDEARRLSSSPASPKEPTCERCGGTAVVYDVRTTDRWAARPCPDCGGSGRASASDGESR